MEKVARRVDAPLLPERGLTTSSAVDADLRDRIRSLLISRNRRYPPKTPCSTPDYSYQTRDPDGNHLDLPPVLPHTYRFSPAEAIAELTRLTYEPPDMGATRFDGPAGQVDDDDADKSPRRPSQPNRQNDRNSTVEGPRSHATSGLNQRSHADVLGRDASFVDGLKRATSSASKTSKTSTGTRIPRFHLRTVPPAVDVNKALRPAPLHVPGSYRSEVPSRKEQVSRATSPPPDDDLDTTGEDPQAMPTYAGLGDGSPHKAIDMLTQVAEHAHTVADPSRSSLHRTPSQAKLTPTSPVKQPQDLLLNFRAGGVAVGQAAQPVLTSSAGHGHGHYHDNPSGAPVSIVGDDNEERKVGASVALNARDNLGFSTHPEEGSDPLGGPKISALLAQLPPLRQSTMKDVSASSLTTEPFVVPEKASTNTYSPSVSSLESVPLNADEGVLSQDSPLLPKPSQANSSAKGERGKRTDLEVEEEASATQYKNSSQKSPKASTASRAMSMLSEISARTGLQTPSLRSITRRKKSGSTAISNLTTRPRRHFAATTQDKATLSAGKGYKALGDETQVEKPENSDSIDRFLALRNQQKNGTAFTKVIHDLESLLNQALTIAGQAADQDDAETTPLKARHLNHVHIRAHSTESIDSSQGLSSLSGGGDEEDHYTSVPPQQVTIEEPKSDALYRGHFRKARDGTPYPAQTRQASAVPYLEVDDKTHMKPQNTNRLLDLPSAPKAAGRAEEPSWEQSVTANDWAVIRAPSHTSKLRLETKPPPRAPQTLPNAQPSTKEQHALLLRAHGASESTISREVVRDYVNAHQQPPIQPRLSSKRLKKGRVPQPEELNLPDPEISDSDGQSDCEHVPYMADFKTAGIHYHPVVQETMAGDGHYTARPGGRGIQPRQDTAASLRDADDKQKTSHHRERSGNKDFTLNDRHHFSIRESHGFSLSRSHRRSPIARDWSTSRKRYVATVTCITTAFMGLIIGIYAGEVPAIQYAIADEHHYTILGNVLFFLGLAITTALFYPLPLLHGRKPYTLAALAILLPLQFPQALAISSQRSPNVATYRIGLLLPRIFAGIVMGFANINFITTLLDLFGASLQSGNPHQETVNVNDVRRHGGGMGVWLGIWTWCAIGSIGIGFLIGAGIISGLDVSWGFWITIVVNAAVLVLNILSPEVRRSAYRRSMAEVRSGGEVSRRVARGEIKMHLESTGPIWWWEEVIAGHVLAVRMLLQPGFAILSLYLGWIYGQVVLIIVLLGALLSKYYRFHPQYVGLGVAIIPLGALFAIPFQKASLFSRARHHAQRTDSMTFEKRVTWTSHLVRRAIFMISLPFAGLAYTLASGGQPTNYMVPIIFAGLIGFLSNLAIAECQGIIMETYDTSDLQPGMTGRPRRVLPEETRKKRTNFSCFPRVTAGFAVAQTFAFVIAAGVTAWGGVVERHLGAQTATTVMAGVLLILTLLLIAILTRFKVVQIIPSERFGTNILSGPEDEWKPVIIGTPSGTTRRMSVLELGTLSRWSEIRRRNKLSGPVR
ncbi:hypothetical protein HO173_004481 [Letharia columbiana]|uniref:Polyamine transport protein n=1 Tax=Letharia columbiana TaxID=112416 RepID=A0A8H6FZG4_9LECA|nr:uncharacterized protein HO173_004481 [Letharia columbiana]KAF6237591.1 hypothetical protein HO173_004481 [Letharia columbiana]